MARAEPHDLAAGTPVYAQVDSVNTDTSYGGVLEDHEFTGGKYNNIAAGVSVAGTAAAGGDRPHIGEQGQPASSDDLPPR